MERLAVESLFFRPTPASIEELAKRRRESSDGYQNPPVRHENAPFHMDLAAVLPERTKAIRDCGQIVFHVIGDTGGVTGRGAQENVADHMSGQINSSQLPKQPSFLYHLGDVVYNNGENSNYHDQFYHPYQDYPAPIFAIPGNHDGKVSVGSPESLAGFMKHFCASEALHPMEAGHSDRPTMTQPNCYWTLQTPLVTIIGLNSNVSGELDNTDANATAQRDWLTSELRIAAKDKCLLLAVHHPIFSLGSHGPTLRVAKAIDHAIRKSGRVPDMVLSGHDHNYQRFTRTLEGRQIPYLVVGAGGMAGYDLARVHTHREIDEDVELASHNHKAPGFLRLKITADRLVGDYFTVPGPSRENDKEKRVDQFKLDLKRHRLK